MSIAYWCMVGSMGVATLNGRSVLAHAPGNAIATIGHVMQLFVLKHPVRIISCCAEARCIVRAMAFVLADGASSEAIQQHNNALRQWMACQQPAAQTPSSKDSPGREREQGAAASTPLDMEDWTWNYEAYMQAGLIKGGHQKIAAPSMNWTGNTTKPALKDAGVVKDKPGMGKWFVKTQALARAVLRKDHVEAQRLALLFRM